LARIYLFIAGGIGDRNQYFMPFECSKNSFSGSGDRVLFQKVKYLNAYQHRRKWL